MHISFPRNAFTSRKRKTLLQIALFRVSTETRKNISCNRDTLITFSLLAYKMTSEKTRDTFSYPSRSYRSRFPRYVAALASRHTFPSRGKKPSDVGGELVRADRAELFPREYNITRAHNAPEIDGLFYFPSVAGEKPDAGRAAARSRLSAPLCELSSRARKAAVFAASLGAQQRRSAISPDR